MKLRILFVDDEPKILRGLRRQLSDMSKEWNMEFVEGGTNALKRMEEKSFDVIVSDMRMPGMNGGMLLRKVQETYPEVIRFILSGYTNDELVLKTIGYAHQFLAKPCNIEQLSSTIRHSIELRQLLIRDEIKHFVTSIRTLPSLPQLYQEIMDTVNSPKANLQDVASIVSQDPAMTAKLLQIINSAFFGLGRKSKSNMEEVVHFLGITTIRALALQTHVFSMFEDSNYPGLSIDRLWKHSLSCATLAQQIAKENGAEQSVVEDAYVAGLLHDIGLLIFSYNQPEKYHKMLNRSVKEKILIAEMEQEEFGCNHGQVGAYLLGLWGCSNPIVSAVAYHQDPEKSNNISFSPLTAVHVANFMHNEMETRDGGAPHSELNVQYLDKIGLSHKLPVWRKIAENLFEKTNSLELGSSEDKAIDVRTSQ